MLELCELSLIVDCCGNVGYVKVKRHFLRVCISARHPEFRDDSAACGRFGGIWWRDELDSYRSGGAPLSQFGALCQPGSC